MSNEAKTGNDVTGASSKPGESSSEMNPQAEMISNGVKASLAVFEPLSRASIDFFSNVVNASLQAIQKISEALVSKK